MAQSGSQRGRRAFRAPARQQPEIRRRSLQLERLEDRALLAGYTYPYGASSVDTGEYMLGDVAVNVVLMESDPTLAPYDNNPTDDPTNPGRGAPAENWTAQAIAAVKANVSAGLQWWKDTLYNVFPSAPANLLNFKINWQYADAPVPTGYEPIARPSDDFLVLNGTPPGGWLYDFLNHVGFAESGNFSADIRAFNDFTRQTNNTDWAFTIFVVNNAVDTDKLFAPGGSFSQAFAFAGGRFMVVPASRPAATYSHEAGHQFYALDQYFGGGTYSTRRGYYNTQNLNAADNPAAGFVQANSIMARDEPGRPVYTTAYNTHTSDPFSLAQLGWQDSDGDGLFDVLDVPFALGGSGQHNGTTGVYTFNGSTVVGVLNNANTSGTGRDITINQISLAEASINGGPWVTVQTFPPRTYQTNVNFSLPIGTEPGVYEIRVRSSDSRTGVKSNIFTDEFEITSDSGASVRGIVFRDANSNGRQNVGEPAFPDIGIEVLDQEFGELDLVREVDPNSADHSSGQVLSTIAASDGVTLSAVGSGAFGSDVYARTSGFGLVFGARDAGGAATNLWNETRKFRVDFTAPVSNVTLKAFAGSAGSSSFARLEAYSADGTLLTRANSSDLKTASANLTVSRAAGDIQYVIAYGRAGTSVLLDWLTWGPGTSATSSTLGHYSLNGLPDGTYKIRVTAPAGHVITTPPGGYATVTVSGGVSHGMVDFGIGPERDHPFFNVELAANVNNDAKLAITAADALMVINFINAGFAPEGEIGSNFLPASVGYVDVDNNGRCTAMDALSVINIINAGLGGVGGGGEGGGGEGEQFMGSFTGGSSSLEGAGPEGEMTVAVPRNAAEYFAQDPGRILSLPGDDQPCSCGTCVGVRTDVALAALQDTAIQDTAIQDTALQDAGASTSRTAGDPLELFLASARLKQTNQTAQRQTRPVDLSASPPLDTKRRSHPALATATGQTSEKAALHPYDDAHEAAIDELLNTDPS